MAQKMRFSCKNAHTILNTYCFSTAIMVTRTSLGVTLYVHCLFWRTLWWYMYLYGVNKPLWKAPYTDAVGVSLPLRAWGEKYTKFFTKILSETEILDWSYLLDRQRQSERTWQILHHQPAATLESYRGHNSLWFTTTYCSTRQFPVSATDRPSDPHLSAQHSLESAHPFLLEQLPSG